MSALASLDDFASSGYFKPNNHMNDIAILVEPKSLERGVPNTYRGKTRERDEVTADATVFGTEDAVNSGKPTDVLKGVKFTHPGLTNTLGRAMGKALVVRIVKRAFDNGEGYALDKVAPAIEGEVAKYLDAREKAVEEALASAPSFD